MGEAAGFCKVKSMARKKRVSFAERVGHAVSDIANAASVAATGSEIGILELAAEDELERPAAKRRRSKTARRKRKAKAAPKKRRMNKKAAPRKAKRPKRKKRAATRR